MVDTPLPRD
jgi:putative addiction module killer protein/probable addiction module antidote protein